MKPRTIIENEPLARYTAWRIGGPARWFAAAASADELGELIGWARERETPVFVLGGGSNVLVADGGYHGLVIRNRAAEQRVETRDGEPVLWTEAGAPTAGTVRRLAAQGYGGFGWAEGLPGTIGGAVYGNAGCYGGDMARQLVRAWVLCDGEVEEWPVERFGYAYRTSVLKARAALPPLPATGGEDKPAEFRASLVREGLGAEGKRAGVRGEHSTVTSQGSGAASSGLARDPRSPTVLAAELRLTRGDPQLLRAEMAAIAETRKSKTPAGSSCGSVFKNPPGTTAGTLLDQAGLKGTAVGGAIVSEKHANYIVNRGDGTAADVLRLSGIMRRRVIEVFGVELELEVQLIGEQS